MALIIVAVVRLNRVQLIFSKIKTYMNIEKITYNFHILIF